MGIMTVWLPDFATPVSAQMVSIQAVSEKPNDFTVESIVMLQLMQ